MTTSQINRGLSDEDYWVRMVVIERADFRLMDHMDSINDKDIEAEVYLRFEGEAAEYLALIRVASFRKGKENQQNQKMDLI